VSFRKNEFWAFKSSLLSKDKSTTREGVEIKGLFVFLFFWIFCFVSTYTDSFYFFFLEAGK
jgi:hypothetical protein